MSRSSLLLFGALLVGCATKDAVSDDTDASGDTDASDDTEVPVSFADVQAQVFQSCGAGMGPQTCHGRAPFQAGLDLTEANAYDDLVGVVGTTGDLLVKPGSPDESLLFMKLTNALPSDGSKGEPMPKGEAIQWQELPADQIALVRAWIAGGAAR